MIKQHLTLILLWMMFCLLHSLFADDNWKYKMQLLLRSNFKFYKIAYSLFALITLITVITYNFSIRSILLWQVYIIEKIVSLATMISAAFVMLMFTKKFFFDLSGADVFQKKQTSRQLINTYFYKHVRHPLYSATLIFIWSIFIWKPLLSNLITCVCVTIYTFIGIYFEEKKLIIEFGDNYIAYQLKTPMLVPRLFK